MKINEVIIENLKAAAVQQQAVKSNTIYPINASKNANKVGELIKQNKQTKKIPPHKDGI